MKTFNSSFPALFRRHPLLLIFNSISRFLVVFGGKVELDFLFRDFGLPQEVGPLCIDCHFGVQSEINTVDCRLKTALHIAVESKHVECVKALLELNIDLKKADVDRNTALHTCASTGDMYEIFERLIGESNINLKNREGNCPLHLAAQSKQLEKLVMLMSHDANLNSQNAVGNTALHIAVNNCDLEAIQALLVFGIDANILNRNSHCVRHLAAVKDLGEVLTWLDVVGAEKCNTESEDCNEGCFVSVKFPSPPSTELTGDELFQEAIKSMTQQAKDSPECSGALESEEKVFILSLDGGGIRGLVLTQMLIELENIINKPIIDTFNWLSGTSPGGILALMLAKGHTTTQCRNVYFRFKNTIFQGCRPYESEPLEAVLKMELDDSSVMGDIKGSYNDFNTTLLQWIESLQLSNCFEILGITETDPVTGAVIPNGREELLWHAARATGAAPMYFRAFGPFIDGSLISNSPSLDTMKEMHQCNQALIARVWHQEVSKCLLPSMGTGCRPVSSC